jgi:hypothetical protein
MDKLAFLLIGKKIPKNENLKFKCGNEVLFGVFNYQKWNLYFFKFSILGSN